MSSDAHQFCLHIAKLEIYCIMSIIRSLVLKHKNFLKCRVGYPFLKSTPQFNQKNENKEAVRLSGI